MAITLEDFLLYYLTALIAAGILSIVVYKILKRNPKNRFNQIFSLSYISITVSILIDLILSSVADPAHENLVNFLFILVNMCLYTATGFILLSILILYGPKKVLENKNQILFVLIYAGLASIYFFIPKPNAIRISPEGIQYAPKIYLPEFVFNLVFYTSSLSITMFFALKVLRDIKDPKVKKRFLLFIIGICVLYYFPFGIAISNYIDTEEIRWLHMNLTALSLSSVFLIYYGIGSNLD